MKSSDFYYLISFIAKHKNTTALINIKEFKRLVRIKGEYVWKPFEIGSLPALPIETHDFKEDFRGSNEIVTINLTPIWTFYTNGETVITPNIETFVLNENSTSYPRYTLRRKISPNHHYLSNSPWAQLLDAAATKENAIEWNKKATSTLLTPTDSTFMKFFLDKYKDELEEFNKLYLESAKTTEELKSYQKRL